jgi:Zn-dependent protease with chaperone function
MTMHSGLLLLTVVLALWWRWRWQPATGTSVADWSQRWDSALLAFCLPPLLLLSAAIAVLGMGHHGHMLGMTVSPYGCWVARSIVLAGIGTWVYGLIRGLRSHFAVRRYPLVTVLPGVTARCLPSHEAFAGLVGLWQPQIIVTQGLLQILTPEELRAILAHEQAHRHYGDTWQFLGLGWLRRLTCWLPHTQSLWEEMLLLREIRADCWAAQQVDPLLLAELLVKLAALPLVESPLPAIAFSQSHNLDRLQQRINALLTEPTELPSQSCFPWLLLSLTPLGTIWLHG